MNRYSFLHFIVLLTTLVLLSIIPITYGEVPPPSGPGQQEQIPDDYPDPLPQGIIGDLPPAGGVGTTGTTDVGDEINRGQRTHNYKVMENFVKSPWFSLVSGCASILALILAMYPIQVRSLPTSVFRTLVWKKTLLLSFGLGIIVFSGIQFYNQFPPGGKFFGIPYALLHGKMVIYSYGEGGTHLWGILFLLGVALFSAGAVLDPARKIRERLLDEGKEIHEVQARELGRILRGGTYEKLTIDEKDRYDQLLRYYQLLQTTMIGLLIGYPVMPSKFRSSATAAASDQAEELLSVLNLVGNPGRRRVQSQDIEQ